MKGCMSAYSAAMVLLLLLVAVVAARDLQMPQRHGCLKTTPRPTPCFKAPCYTPSPRPLVRCPSCVNQRCTPNACNQAVGIYFPGNCNKFCKCNTGGAIEFDCPLGLLFDEVQGVCVWPYDSSCSNSAPYPGC